MEGRKFAATPGKGCRPGLMMCNRRNGKRQVKLGTQLTQRRLEADDETSKTIANDIQEFGDSKYLGDLQNDQERAKQRTNYFL
ncbi:uncharacterized protein LOC113667337 isoform X1 [Pocillopora damicornis]|uniref:uncharacterized protein LOC113667337 isoform X1 n=1 Tax=Pocillopora damicornis TaxID=46731 RepID=UPI000F54D6B8|nr:uncharacterized protein LOC113667337 isoform X1 [Pocillopora damicornis]